MLGLGKPPGHHEWQNPRRPATRAPSSNPVNHLHTLTEGLQYDQVREPFLSLSHQLIFHQRMEKPLNFDRDTPITLIGKQLIFHM